MICCKVSAESQAAQASQSTAAGPVRMLKSDPQIRQDVEAELKWSPDLDSTDICVHVSEGVVTLSGYARNYYEKYLAEGAAKRVAGVTAVADDVLVRLPASHGSTDPEIARAALAAIKTALPQAWQNIQPTVEANHITLDGTVEWNYQRVLAEEAVVGIAGVVGVTNAIRIVTNLEPGQIKEQIQQAFLRNAVLDAGNVCVRAEGSVVTLTGAVRSWAEYGAAEDTAWAAPGVYSVNNELVVGPAP